MSSSPKRTVVVVDQGRMFSLTRDIQGNLYIEVVCGGLAMEIVEVPLNAEEEQEFERHGKPYLDDLSLKVCKSRKAFSERESSTGVHR